MTGDEVYFYQWGVYPDCGYYDHPPMVGWMLYALNGISSHPLSLRIATVLLLSLVALGMVDLMRRMVPDRQATAYWLGTFFLVLPFTWALNVVTTDTPLILFVFASGYCFIRADRSGRRPWYVASGIFLGLALLSKYFAGLLTIAYFGYLARSRHGWLNLALISACALPFAALNVVYNATHCWNNVMFNLLNRHENSQWSLGTVATYVGMMIYLITPLGVAQTSAVAALDAGTRRPGGAVPGAVCAVPAAVCEENHRAALGARFHAVRVSVCRYR